MKISKYNRSPFQIEAVQVTEENIQEVAAWCEGEVKLQEKKGSREQYILVKVHRPLNEKHKMAFVGDWVTKSETGYKVYTDRAFSNTFYEEPYSERTLNVFNNLEEMRVTDEPVPAEPEPEVEAQPTTVQFLEEIESTRDKLGFNTPKNLMQQ